MEDYLEKYQDPIAHFQEVARQMTEKENESRQVTLSFDREETLPIDTDRRKNLGYAAILKIYHQLELPQFLNNKARHQGFEYNTNSIMTLLAISRILSPGSKKKGGISNALTSRSMTSTAPCRISQPLPKKRSDI
jgi:hypothetical protein